MQPAFIESCGGPRDSPRGSPCGGPCGGPCGSPCVGLFLSISESFVDQRRQSVQSLPSFFVIALISTSIASTLLVHLNHPTFDLIAVCCWPGFDIVAA